MCLQFLTSNVRQNTNQEEISTQFIISVMSTTQTIKYHHTPSKN